MKRAKAFPYVFFHSLSSLEYYKDILKAKRSFSIKYFLGLASLAALISSLALAFRIAPSVRNTINQVLDNAEAMYPNDLVIKTENNTWSLNTAEPLIIPFAFEETTTDAKIPHNFIVFYKQGTIDDLSKYDTFILVNEKNVIIKSPEKIESYPLQDIPNGTFDKSTLEKAVNNVRKLLTPLEIGLILLMSFFIILYYFGFRVLYLFPVAAAIWLIAIVVGTDLTFKQAYRIGVHTMTLPVVIELMLVTSGTQFKMPLWFMLLNIMYAAVVVVGLSKNFKPHHTKK